MTKKEARKRTRALITESAKHMRKNLERIFLTGAIDIYSAPDNNILPLTLYNALLREEMFQYSGKGTKWEKQIKKDSENIYSVL